MSEDNEMEAVTTEITEVINDKGQKEQIHKVELKPKEKKKEVHILALSYLSAFKDGVEKEYKFGYLDKPNTDQINKFIQDSQRYQFQGGISIGIRIESASDIDKIRDSGIFQEKFIKKLLLQATQ